MNEVTGKKCSICICKMADSGDSSCVKDKMVDNCNKMDSTEPILVYDGEHDQMENTSYGVLVENLSSMHALSEISTDPDNTCSKNDKDDESVEIMDRAEKEYHDIPVKRSYSIESGDVLNDKYSSNDRLDDNDENYELTLDVLPAEIFLHICSFIDAKFVIKTLGHVCKSFHVIVNDETFWKVRMGKRWRQKYPAIPVNDKEFNWAEACIEREEQHRLWSNHKNNMQYYQFKEDLFAAVDVVHLMKEGQLLAAGSRDRYLTLLDLTKLDPDNPVDSAKKCQHFSLMKAHKGWIWSMSSLDNNLVTSSWDTYVKFWDISAECKEYLKVKCSSAVLCTHYEEGYVLAGSYDKKVFHIDPRTGTIIGKKRYHTRPVLCMAVNEKYILTGSEDQTVAVYDRRADKIYKTLQLDSFPMSMSYGMDQLWIGTKSGSLQLVDASDGDFDLIEINENIHQGKITGVIHGLGSIFTSSTDKTVNILEPTLKPSVIGTLAEHTADIAGISFQNDVLACASSDVSIGIWTPKDHKFPE